MAIAAKTKKVRVTKPKKLEYTASMNFTLLHEIYTAKGKTAREAIENLKAKNTKGHSILTVSKGKESKEKVISAPLSFRMFSENKLVRELSLKHICTLFNF